MNLPARSSWSRESAERPPSRRDQANEMNENNENKKGAVIFSTAPLKSFVIFVYFVGKY